MPQKVETFRHLDSHMKLNYSKCVPYENFRKPRKKKKRFFSEKVHKGGGGRVGGKEGRRKIIHLKHL